MKLVKKIAKQRQVRAWRVRKKVRGTAERPRLSVFRSGKHISAQLIDDESGVTVVSASSLEPDFRKAHKVGGNVAAALAIGKSIGERALSRGVKAAAFDRGSYRYQGRVAAVANAARQAGLDF
jgi:large subunit ribosomal protein L18